MKIVKAGYRILDDLDGAAIIRKIEKVARVCYKSGDKIAENTAEGLVRGLIKNQHLAMLEHYSFSVLFRVDRGVSHEIVRHRLASFAQESTRFVDYKEDIEFIEPCYLTDGTYDYCAWMQMCKSCEDMYHTMREQGLKPEEARAILPNSLKTEIVVTANLREWRHILALRACGTTGKPHPQMLEVMIPLLEELKGKIPVIFDDLEVKA